MKGTKTVIAAPPGATGTTLAADNTKIISNTSTPARSSGMSNFNRLTNAANVLNSPSINSNGFPVNTTVNLQQHGPALEIHTLPERFSQ